MCIQITRARVHFNGDSTANSLLSPNFEPVTLQPRFAASPSPQGLAIFMAPNGQAPFEYSASCRDHSPDFRRALRVFAIHAPAAEPSFVFFCFQHMVFLSGLPSMCFPGPMLLTIDLNFLTDSEINNSGVAKS